ncbi:MAG TPA: hypothetical protein VNT75_26295 [Symbiobacteriaceae bacterium]|nr:hypothetical protein [Symbiobacteriaceae bacterium]
MRGLRRYWRIYSAFAANAVKLMMAYSVWFWVELAGQVMMLIIFVYFWKAVYASNDTIGGMQAAETLSYILVAQIVAPLVRWSLILDFGFALREGGIAIELTRPVDYQARWYVEWTASMVMQTLRLALPLGAVAIVFFGLHLPSDPVVWGYFIASFLIGNAVLFFFDWTFACLAFYTTEGWGLHVLREGVAAFFSGSLLPLQMLPGWLQKIAAFMPFGQALNAPVSILTGITPVGEAPRIIGIQLVWLVGMFVLSRSFFTVASRKVTVQGG